MTSRGAIAISPGAIALDAELLELSSYHQPSNLSIIANPNDLPTIAKTSLRFTSRRSLGIAQTLGRIFTANSAAFSTSNTHSRKHLWKRG
ncbi:hypothetical protein SPLC1_S050530 [Arthrospira platensis C1]|nr:hypothetical protein SPLC1_S050530 [Arthrospira platensis C1]